MTKPKKTVEQLALEYWNMVESILLESARMQMKLVIRAFIDGYIYRDKEIRDGVRTRSPKKR